MRNINRISLGRAALCLFLSLSAIGLPAWASQHEEPPPAKTTVPAPQTTEPPRTAAVTAILDSLFSQLRREEPPLGSRSNLCPVTGRLGKTDTLWSDRPLFLWRGSAGKIALQDYDTNQPLWSRTVSASSQQVVYDGKPLQPGKVYEWLILANDAPKARTTFAVMEASERNRLAPELQTLDTTATPALEKARYFSDRGLWSDALQALYTVQNPSSQVLQARQEMLAYLCGESDTQPDSGTLSWQSQ